MQSRQWDEEYRKQVFLTGSQVPQLDFRHFIKWLKKHQHCALAERRALDLGCGNGKNSFYLSDQEMQVTGIDISQVAIDAAKERASREGYDVDFRVGSIAELSDWPDGYFDLAIDMLSSNSLLSDGRRRFLNELWRVLKPGAYALIKVPGLEHDKNAENLLRKFPGPEHHTYVMPKTGITEHVFTQSELEYDFQNYQIHKLEQRSSRTIFDGTPYNRKFWLIYLQKPQG